MCRGARPLVSSLYLDGKKRQIEYEGLHRIYFKCGQCGHRIDNCKVVVVKEPSVGEANNESAGVEMEEGYYGPWLLPNRGQRRNQI